ncbi:hypothetical protein AMAG_01999 [Allomyces macrogynus ATCC 38327]|uniref:DUF7707 domain-containing protein n=1 Tax=Allomyces macrogynus (strain ATCC 38327) TaxID=578462 RepID=A0A0L0S1C8_ALLM3|nr:hypothetical protein AMAG_01999 [Allomyces macrogynus ATCC 38327]|eukprot:KNE56164.1 hypothetical protein AMAG_01999 [Allomyces macrogynus ATCC 38327]
MTGSRTPVPTLFAVFLLVSTLIQLAAAQTAAQINATAVSTRVAWCQQQTAMCSSVCAFKTMTNVCSYTNLAFACVCTNGTRIDFSDSVDMTIPYFSCITYKWQPCVNACMPSDQKCVDACNTAYVCGRVKADPTKTVIAGTDSTTSTVTATNKAVITNNSGTVNALGNDAVARALVAGEAGVVAVMAAAAVAVAGL